MKGIVIHHSPSDSPAPPELRWETVADLSWGVDEVLVDVKATAVNRADLMQAEGKYPPPPGASPLLGLEMAGVIAAVGREVRGWRVGQRVCALLPGGGYAEQVAVPAGLLLPLPDGWTFGEGAAVPEVWYTAFVNLFLEGELKAGETVLIHAAGSGVGTAAIQLAREAGAEIIATAGTEEKCEMARTLGAGMAINYKIENFAESVLAQTDGRGVDVILDPVGAGYLADNLRVLAPLGRLVQIGLLSGARAEIDLGRLMIRRLRLIGSVLRSRSPAEKIAITAAFKERCWPLLTRGAVRPIIDSTFPIEEAAAAHTYVRQNRNVGKVILEIADG